MTEEHQTDVTDKPELHDLIRALKKDQGVDLPFDPNYPPFDEEQFEHDHYQALKKRGGGYGSPGDF